MQTLGSINITNNSLNQRLAFYPDPDHDTCYNLIYKLNLIQELTITLWPWPWCLLQSEFITNFDTRTYHETLTLTLVTIYNTLWRMLQSIIPLLQSELQSILPIMIQLTILSWPWYWRLLQSILQTILNIRAYHSTLTLTMTLVTI